LKAIRDSTADERGYVRGLSRMRRSTSSRILTTHVGSLPDVAGFHATTSEMETGIVSALAKQRELGLDVINDGEHTKGGDWLRYVETRLKGFEPLPAGRTVRTEGRDREVFAEFYEQYESVEASTAVSSTRPRGRRNWRCTEAIEYCGQDAMAEAISIFKRHLKPDEEAFLTSTAPGSFEPYRENGFYRTQEEFLFALADAMRVEYRMIVDAGLILQVDDAWLAPLWDRIGIGMGLEAFRSYCALRVEALNHALQGIPEERVRYHHCWGSWHGPHAFDLPLADIVDVILRVNAGAYLIEAANARHEHEFAVWKSVQLPDGKILVPGVISHATPIVEHPEFVAYRIRRFTEIVGAENFIAGADCGFGGRAHPQIGWAKLGALIEGARIASSAAA